MLVLLLMYLVYLVLYAVVSYVILYHFTFFRHPGDKSFYALVLYLMVTFGIILGSLALLKPV